tara:strand:+ start:4510 stop:4635 length:126 start_codon:yes stop_codon:yes gene_type:complete
MENRRTEDEIRRSRQMRDSERIAGYAMLGLIALIIFTALFL